MSLKTIPRDALIGMIDSFGDEEQLNERENLLTTIMQEPIHWLQPKTTLLQPRLPSLSENGWKKNRRESSDLSIFTLGKILQ
jgi:hypothetical protein